MTPEVYNGERPPQEELTQKEHYPESGDPLENDSRPTPPLLEITIGCLSPDRSAADNEFRKQLNERLFVRVSQRLRLSSNYGIEKQLLTL